MHSALKSNAFRLLSIPGDADLKEVYERQNRLQLHLQMDTADQQMGYRFVPALTLSQEDLLDAVHRIENQASRQLEEMFWIHELDGQFNISHKNSDEVLSQFRREAKSDTTKGAVALHNAAVVLTLTACNSNGNKRVDYWRDSIHFWAAVNQNETFWQFFEDRAALLDEDQHGKPISEVRSDLGNILANALIEELWKTSRAQDANTISALIDICTNNEYWLPTHDQVREVAVQSAKQATVGIGAEIDHINSLDEQTDKETVRQSLRRTELKIDTLGNEVDRILAPFGKIATETGIADTRAFALRRVSICYFNLLSDNEEALRLVVQARGLAQDLSLQHSLDDDWRHIQRAILINDAIGSADTAQYGDASAKLAAALNLSTEDQRAEITELQAAFRRAKVFRSVDRSRCNPSLQTINGCGFRLYGRRDADSESRSYVTTHWFVLLLIPIFPVAAYRVADAGPRSYNIFGKVPLSPFLSKYRWAVVLAVVALIALSNIDTGTSSSFSTPTSSTQVQPSISPSPTSPSPPSEATSPPSTSQVTKSDSRAQERAALESERQALQRITDELDATKKSLDKDEADLDRIKSYIDSVKARYTSDTVPDDAREKYNNFVDEYNVRGPAYNRRLQEYNSDVDVYEQRRASFNARVDQYNANR